MSTTTQERLAETSCLDCSYIAGVEAGARNVSLDAIVKIAVGLAVAPAALFLWDEDGPA